MTGFWSRARRWWAAQEHAWEVFLRAQRPWEQQGPLRWQGATTPDRLSTGERYWAE